MTDGAPTDEVAVARSRVRDGLVWQTGALYWTRGGPNWSAAVALRLLLALIPVVVLAAVALAPWLPPVSARSGSRLLGGTLDSGIAAGFGDLGRATQSLSVLAVAGFIWTGSTLFSCLETAAATLHGVGGRPFWRQRLLGVGLMAALVGGIAAGVAVALLVGRAAPQVRATQPLATIAASCAVYALILRVLPPIRLRWRDVLPGVALCGAGTALLNVAWPVAGKVLSAETTLSHALLAGSIALVTYIYLLAEVLVLGLSLNATVLARRAARYATVTSEARYTSWIALSSPTPSAKGR